MALTFLLLVVQVTGESKHTAVLIRELHRAGVLTYVLVVPVDIDTTVRLVSFQVYKDPIRVGQRRGCASPYVEHAQKLLRTNVCTITVITPVGY